MRICLSLLIVLYDCQAPCTYKALLSQGTPESIFVSGHLHRKWMLGGREWKVQASQQLGEDPESCRPTKDNRGKRTLIIPLPQHSVALWHCLEPSLRNWKYRWRIFQGWRQARATWATSYTLFHLDLPLSRGFYWRLWGWWWVSPRKAARLSGGGQPKGSEQCWTFSDEINFSDHSCKALVSGNFTFHVCRLKKVSFLLDRILETK